MLTRQLKEVVESIRKQTPRGWILMSPNSIGEVLITCAFARSLIEKYQYPITLCVRPEHTEMVNALYPNRFTAVISMDMELMRSFSTSGFIPKDHFDIDFPINLSPLHYGDGRLNDIHDLVYKRNGSSGLTATDIWRHMLHLDWNSPMEKPCLDFFNQENSVFSSLGLNQNNYVFFLPGNNTTMPISASFWSHLEELFNQKNHTTLVNIQGSMLIDKSLLFNKTKQLNLGILDAAYLSNKSYMTISGSNGLMLLNSFLDYTDENKPFLQLIATDKYCKHYDKLANSWDEAFVSYNAIPSMYHGAPEMISQSGNINQWAIASNLSNSQYKKAANAIFMNDQDSTFHIKPNNKNYMHDFPIPLNYKKSI